MPTSDPFDRVIARESKLRRRGQSLTTPEGTVRMAAAVFGVMAVLWAGVLAAHWWLLGDPRWLAVLHTVLFTLTVGYWAVAALFAGWLLKRHPGLRTEL